MWGIDGHYTLLNYYRPFGSMHLNGFDKMKDGETIILKLTMHRPIPWQIDYSITSEVVEDSRPFVLEP